MTRKLNTLLQPQVSVYMMEQLGRELNALDISENLSNWAAEPIGDGQTVQVTATVKYNVPMTSFRRLVAEAARVDLRAS